MAQNLYVLAYTLRRKNPTVGFCVSQKRRHMFYVVEGHFRGATAPSINDDWVLNITIKEFG